MGKLSHTIRNQMKSNNRKENHLSNKYDGDVSNSRSSQYQDKFRQNIFESFDYLPTQFISNEMSQLNEAEISFLWELEHDLQDIMWYLIETHLSKHQIAVLHIQKLAILQGETQWWMAEQLGINQCSIVKCLSGSQIYEGGQIKRYGGIKKKLEKIIQECPLIRTKLIQIEALNYEQIRLPHFLCFKKIIGNAAKYEQYLQETI
jgi:hypothetical protein